MAQGISFYKPEICDDFPTYFWQVFVMTLYMLHMIQPRIDSIVPKSSMKLRPNRRHAMVWSANYRRGKNIITHCSLPIVVDDTGDWKNVGAHKWHCKESNLQLTSFQVSNISLESFQVASYASRLLYSALSKDGALAYEANGKHIATLMPLQCDALTKRNVLMLKKRRKKKPAHEHWFHLITVHNSVILSIIPMSMIDK